MFPGETIVFAVSMSSKVQHLYHKTSNVNKHVRVVTHRSALKGSRPTILYKQYEQYLHNTSINNNYMSMIYQKPDKLSERCFCVIDVPTNQNGVLFVGRLTSFARP